MPHGDACTEQRQAVDKTCSKVKRYSSRQRSQMLHVSRKALTCISWGLTPLNPNNSNSNGELMYIYHTPPDNYFDVARWDRLKELASELRPRPTAELTDLVGKAYVYVRHEAGYEYGHFIPQEYDAGGLFLATYFDEASQQVLAMVALGSTSEDEPTWRCYTAVVREGLAQDEAHLDAAWAAVEAGKEWAAVAEILALS